MSEAAECQQYKSHWTLVFQKLPPSACFHLTFETGIVTTGEPNASNWARFGDSSWSVTVLGLWRRHAAHSWQVVVWSDEKYSG